MNRREFLKAAILATAGTALLRTRAGFSSEKTVTNEVAMRVDKKNNNKVSLLGFGCMRLPTKGSYTDIDEEKVFEMVDYAMQHGVNYYDTATPYHGGESERVLGKALAKYPRESYYIADKLSTWMVNSEAEMEQFFNTQLQKCRTGYFDYYLLHALTASKLQKIRELKCYEFLFKKKQEGKIRNLGFSFHDGPEALQQIVAEHDWDFAQIQLNYLDWTLQDAKTQYEILARKNIPVIIMEPLRGGALVTLCDEAVKILKRAEPDASTASWALRFAASQPAVLTVLSGMSEMAHLVDNVKTMTPFTPLTKTEYDTLDLALAAYRKSSPVPCTACKYCMPCPAGVDIPTNIGIYNDYLLHGKRTGQLFMNYKSLEADARAENCVDCGKCEKACPQHIGIPKIMQEITAIVEKTTTPSWL